MTSGAEYWAGTIHGMREGLKAMQGKRDALLTEYEATVQDCATMERAIEAMQRRLADSEQEVVQAAAAQASSPGTAISFDGCENAQQRLVRMAESWGGVVNAGDAADLLIGLGISQSSRNNLIAELQRQMSSLDDTWQYTGARTYRYLPYQNGAARGTGTGPE